MSESKKKYKTGMFPMVGDLLHLGHLYSLKVAKKCCEKLIVALNVDPTVDNPNKNKPVESPYERWFRLDSCKYVDEIIPYCGEEDLIRVLTTTYYDVRFVGDDHMDNWTGKDYEDEVGIENLIISRRHGESSTSLKDRIVNSNKGDKK